MPTLTPSPAQYPIETGFSPKPARRQKRLNAEEESSPSPSLSPNPEQPTPSPRQLKQAARKSLATG